MTTAADPTATREEVTREHPASAFHLVGGPVAFEAASPAADGTVPVRLLARTGQPIEHGYWGRIVHDLSGMQAKASVPLDHRHRPDEVIGFGHEFDSKGGDLWVGGRLVPFKPDDVAAEIAFKAAKGVPYEASIDFRGPALFEEVGAGLKTQVNGYTFEGPGIVVREWTLRAVAICEHGADPGTRAEFSDDGSDTVSVRQFSTPEGEMTKEPDQKTPADEPLTRKTLFQSLARAFGFKADEEPADPSTEGDGGGDGPAAAQQADPPDEAQQQAADPPAAGSTVDEVRDEMRRFAEAFGDDGLKYFSAGKSFEQAAKAHLDKLRAELADANTKLAAVDRGEDEPAEFADGEEERPSARQRKLARTLGGRLGAFAASIQLPTKRGGDRPRQA